MPLTIQYAPYIASKLKLSTLIRSSPKFISQGVRIGNWKVEGEAVGENESEDKQEDKEVEGKG